MRAVSFAALLMLTACALPPKPPAYDAPFWRSLANELDQQEKRP